MDPPLEIDVQGAQLWKSLHVHIFYFLETTMWDI